MKIIKNSDLGRITLRLTPDELSMGVNITLLNNGGIEFYIMRALSDGGDIGMIAYSNNWKIFKEKGERGKRQEFDNQRMTIQELSDEMENWK